MNVKLKSALLGAAALVLLALAPSGAFAGEPVLDSAEKDATFTGVSEGFSAPWTVFVGEPVCQTTDASGTINTGGKSGSMTLHMTGCHLMYLGFTYPCHSASAPLNNTIKFEGSFETTYVTDAKTKPGIKFTIPSTQIICGVVNAGTSTLSGSVLGTLSTPGCGVESRTGTISFKVVTPNPEVKEEHRQITGTGPVVQWTAESKATAGLEADLAIEFNQKVKVTCV